MFRRDRYVGLSRGSLEDDNEEGGMKDIGEVLRAQSRMRRYAVMASQNFDEESPHINNDGTDDNLELVNMEQMTNIRNQFVDDQPLIGIRLSYILREFIPANGGVEAFRDLTTTQVIEQFIKPQTLRMQESFCDMLQRQHRHDAHYSTASAFISHAHSYQFLDTMSAIQYHLRDELDSYIFLDVFCINQHRTNWSYEFLSTTFLFSIKQFGRTIMVMSPWNDPWPFTRAWCVYEAYCTSATESKFEIALSEMERINFLRAVQHHDTQGEINKMLCTIRAEKSEALKEVERDRIHSIIKQTVGFAALDKRLFEQYRSWVVETAQGALDRCSGVAGREEEQLRLLRVLRELHRGQGRLDLAIQCQEKYLALEKKLYGEDSHFQNTSIITLAQIFTENGDDHKAELLYVDIVEKRRSRLGDNHLKTLSSINALAEFYYNRGELNKAEVLWVQCLDGTANGDVRTLVDCSHPFAIKLMSNLGRLHSNQGKLDKAEEILTKCLAKKKIILGEEHQDTIMTMSDLALVHMKSGHQEKAKELYRACLDKMKAVFGKGHTHTLTTMALLASLYLKQRDFEEASRLFEVCLRERRTTLGEDHPETLTAMNNLAELYWESGELHKALVFQTSCLDKQREVLGNHHRDTLKSMSDLALIYCAFGDWFNAEKAFAVLLANQKFALGRNHGDVVSTMTHLAQCYCKQGELTKAIDMWEQCLCQQATTIGVNHVNTAQTRQSLARARRKRYVQKVKNGSFAALAFIAVTVFGAVEYPNQSSDWDGCGICPPGFTLIDTTKRISASDIPYTKRTCGTVDMQLALHQTSQAKCQDLQKKEVFAEYADSCPCKRTVNHTSGVTPPLLPAPFCEDPCRGHAFDESFDKIPGLDGKQCGDVVDYLPFSGEERLCTLVSQWCCFSDPPTWI